MAEALANTRKKWEPKTLPYGKSGGKKERYSINVIHFVQVNADSNQRNKERFKQLVTPTRGDYRSVEGMDAIQSYVSSSGGQ